MDRVRVVGIRLTDTHTRALRRAAEAQGHSLSSFGRKLLLDWLTEHETMRKAARVATLARPDTRSRNHAAKSKPSVG